MQAPQPPSLELKFLSFHEGKKYSKTDIFNKIDQTFAQIDDETKQMFFQKIIELNQEQGLLHISGENLEFTFVGLSLIRNLGSKSVMPNVIIAVYPKWREIDSGADLTSSFFSRYFFSALRSYSKIVGKEKQYFHKEKIGADFYIWGSSQAHLLDCMLALVSDVNRFGIFHEHERLEHLRKGKSNWRKSIKNGKVIISDNTPYFLKPIRMKKNKLFNEISHIHQEVFSHSMTILTEYLIAPFAKISWQKKEVLNHIPNKINSVKQALKATKIQKQRDRLTSLLGVLEAKAEFLKQKQDIVGITSKGFDRLWERALLEVVGDFKKTKRLNELILKRYPLEIQRTDNPAWEKTSMKRHIIDGLAFSGGNQLIIFDAKNYRSWYGLGIGDVVKQYAYERLLQRISTEGSDSLRWDQEFNYDNFDFLRNEIIANVFVFPFNSRDSQNPRANDEINILGKYRLDYMQDVVRNELICVEVNPDMVLKQYNEKSRLLQRRFVNEVISSQEQKS